jgi:hypothetical protein
VSNCPFNRKSWIKSKQPTECGNPVFTINIYIDYSKDAFLHINTSLTLNWPLPCEINIHNSIAEVETRYCPAQKYFNTSYRSLPKYIRLIESLNVTNETIKDSTHKKAGNDVHKSQLCWLCRLTAMTRTDTDLAIAIGTKPALACIMLSTGSSANCSSPRSLSVAGY